MGLVIAMMVPVAILFSKSSMWSSQINDLQIFGQVQHLQNVLFFKRQVSSSHSFVIFVFFVFYFFYF